MNIKMVGIDHSKASVAYREQAALTKKHSVRLMEKLKADPGIDGCVVLSTCNRTEIYISCQEGFSKNLARLFCRNRELDFSVYEPFLTKREGEEAVYHLFGLACGMKSRVFGEDQIISQVKEALSLSREYYCTDSVLEVLFRTAITAAKKVKTQVRLSPANHSVVDEAVRYLEQEGVELQGKQCLVIGNGEMGKLSANALKKAGAEVTVTVRQYKSGIVEIPDGCRRIQYGDRMAAIADCDLVVSATASPNCTISREGLLPVSLKKPVIFMDLAVPRDIDPQIAGLSMVTLYDIDTFQRGAGPDEKQAEELHKAEKILNEYMLEFITWYECRDIIPAVREISQKAALDISSRVFGKTRQLELAGDNKKVLEKNIDEASRKVLDKLIFGLQEKLTVDAWRECIACMKELYSE